VADLVGIYAASHGPLIVRDWHLVPDAPKARLAADFRELGARLTAARPDALVIVSPDHWVNFFLDNLPSICIGVGTEHDGPPELFLKDFPYRPLTGHPALAAHIVDTALARDFEPSISHRLALDHGFCIPLLRMELTALPAIVPMIINDLEPPLPTIRRCLAWGRLLAEAIASFPSALRVAILATGGLSHSIGEPTMGAIDEPFDRDCIRAFEAGRDAAIIDLLDACLAGAGNGSHEIRNWVVAHGAAGGRGFELVDYLAVPEVYVGCGFAAWRPA
jgi:aromatic ring-opening dioxygenase catalytic subunit (LigB family)